MNNTTARKVPEAKYARHRTADEVAKLAAEKGYKVDAMRYNNGSSDYITVYMPGPGSTTIGVMYNTFNGRFFHADRTPGSYFTSDRTDWDGQPWFDAMLEFFMVPMEVA